MGWFRKILQPWALRQVASIGKSIASQGYRPLTLVAQETAVVPDTALIMYSSDVSSPITSEYRMTVDPIR